MHYRALRWVAPPRVYGRWGYTCLDRGGAAHLPDLTPPQLRAEDERRHLANLADHRAAFVTVVEALVLTIASNVVERQRREADFAAGVEALAHSEALALEGTTMGALDRIMDELVRFDATCARGDAAGATRRLRTVIARISGRAVAVPQARTASGGGSR